MDLELDSMSDANVRTYGNEEVDLDAVKDFIKVFGKETALETLQEMYGEEVGKQVFDDCNVLD